MNTTLLIIPILMLLGMPMIVVGGTNDNEFQVQHSTGGSTQPAHHKKTTNKITPPVADVQPSVGTLPSDSVGNPKPPQSVNSAAPKIQDTPVGSQTGIAGN